MSQRPPVVQVAAEEFEKLIEKQRQLQKDMKYRRIGRAKAYLEMCKLRDELSRLAGRMGAL